MSGAQTGTIRLVVYVRRRPAELTVLAFYVVQRVGRWYYAVYLWWV